MKERLLKRIKTDTICTKVVTIVVGIITGFIAIDFVTSLIKKNLGIEASSIILGNLVRASLLLAVFIILSKFMSDIAAKGKPFTLKNISRLRSIAIITIVCSCLPEVVSCIFVLSNSVKAFTLTFTLVNGILMFMGVVIGIVSEVFRYGYELEEEMDSIA